jgi:hypothetical protein
MLIMHFTAALFLGITASVIALPAPLPVAQQQEQGPCWVVPTNDDPNAQSIQAPCDKPEPKPYSSITPTPMEEITPSVEFEPIPSPTWAPAIAPVPTSSTWTHDYPGVQTGEMGGIGGAGFPTPYPSLSTTGPGWGGIGGSMNPWTAAETSHTYSSDYGYSSSIPYSNNGAGWGRPSDSTSTNGWGAPSSTYNNGAGWGRPTDSTSTNGWGVPSSTYNNGAGWGRPTESTYNNGGGWGAPTSTYNNGWGAPTSTYNNGAGWSSPTSTYNNGAGWGPPPPDPVIPSFGEYSPTPLPTWAVPSGGSSGWNNQPGLGGLGGASAPTSTCRRSWTGRCT